MDLNEIMVFIKVIQAGSFSRAAKELDMPNSTVSSKVSSLEKRLGATLITRTTRKLHITATGEAYFKKCLKGLEEINLGETEVAALQGEPQGLLRITAPVELGGTVLPPVVIAFLQKYPQIKIEVILTDRRVELLTEGIDLALRAGELKDSTLIGKKLGYGNFFPFASPKYVRSKGEPAHPRELKDHQCLHFSPLDSGAWKLTGPKGSLSVSAPGRIVVNDLSMLKSLVVNGMGIGLMPSFYCHNELQAGKLVRVMHGWKTSPSPVHFVYPAQQFVSSKLSAFIALAADPIRRALEEA